MLDIVVLPMLTFFFSPCVHVVVACLSRLLCYRRQSFLLTSPFLARVCVGWLVVLQIV